ncbi:MAG: FAD:protein FMN transferase [Gammaproteobacteria bacterium]|nr:FAD:protein FMN transferase [Gammaproteobacteria bacterium]
MHRTAPYPVNKRRYRYRRQAASILSLAALPSVLLFSCLFLSACEQPDKEFNYSIFTFGTLVDITLIDTDKKKADAAFELLQKDFDDYHQHWSPWTDGDLSKINEQLAKGNTDIPLPEHLVPIIKTSISLSEQSGNYFNPAIGKLINLWQFHRHQESTIRPPDEKRIQNIVRKKPLMSDLSIDENNHLISTNSAVALNFGAFAKGYAITLEIEQLKTLGIHNAVINAGGDLSVIGQHGDRPWNIGIRHPRNSTILASVEVQGDESVFTSGDYERSYHFQGQRYHHILDPETGYPTKDVQSVTIIHSDAGLADAAATAILVAGSKRWRQTAKNMGIRYIMLVDAKGDIHITEAMKNRLKFLDKSPTLHIIVKEEL